MVLLFLLLYIHITYAGTKNDVLSAIAAAVASKVKCIVGYSSCP